MSLIKCFECKKKVSIKADACPNCGCPMNKDYTKELNEIEEQINEQQKIIKEQQETINGVKVQVKGQVEELEKEKEDLIKKRVLKRKLIKQLRKQLRKENNFNIFKYLFYFSILIIIILLIVLYINFKPLYIAEKDECESEIIDVSNTNLGNELCKDEDENSICIVYKFIHSSGCYY